MNVLISTVIISVVVVLLAVMVDIFRPPTSTVEVVEEKTPEWADKRSEKRHFHTHGHHRKVSS